MTKAEFEKYIENISVFERMKENLSTLKIDWETDITKIDLSVLASKLDFLNTLETRFKLEWIPIERVPKNFGELFFDGDIERITELFKLIENGTKIIPPIAFKEINYIDGVPEYNDQPLHIGINDGYHRIKLARALNLQKIPVLFIEIPHKTSYSKKNWDMKCIGEKVEFTHKTTGEVQTLPLEDCNFHLTVSGDYFPNTIKYF